MPPTETPDAIDPTRYGWPYSELLAVALALQDANRRQRAATLDGDATGKCQADLDEAVALERHCEILADVARTVRMGLEYLSCFDKRTMSQIVARVSCVRRLRRDIDALAEKFVSLRQRAVLRE